MFRATRAVPILPLLGALLTISACDAATEPDQTPATLPAAYAEFSSSVTASISGQNVVIETNGLPDHTSPYWSPGHALNVRAEPGARLVPGYIDNFVGKYTLTVPANPTRASTSTATGVGAIGIARSGAPIYNDQEGGNQPLDNAIAGFDVNGAHTGPQSYHYHLEPRAWAIDNSALVGVIADGFFLYGRRDANGSYPTNLDDSGGHVGVTVHNPNGEYHYHIRNELYLGAYYILVHGNYQGTPSAIR